MEQSYQIKQTLCARAAQYHMPVSAAFELTPRCNFNCSMCYVRMTPEEMAPIGKERTTQQWLDLAKQAREAGLVFLLLTGGEPLLRPDFEILYRELTNMGMSISINTNGYLLTDKIRKLFLELPPALLNVTLYGTSAESYGRLCGVPGAYKQVTENLQWLKDNGFTVNLNTTITPWNVGDLPEIYAYAKRMELPIRPSIYNFPPVRRSNQQEFQRLPAEQVGILHARDILQQKGIDEVRSAASKLGTPEAAPMSCGLEQGEHMVCYAGRSQFWMSWDGTMMPCGMLNEPKAYPFEVGFEAAWQQIVAQTAAITLCPDCVTCADKDVCTKCAAITSAETGRFDGKPEYMCTVTRSYCEELRRLADGDGHIPE